MDDRNSLCHDYTLFKTFLKNSRKGDEILVNAINSSMSGIDPHDECKSLFEKLKKSRMERSELIDACSQIATDHLLKLKEEREMKMDDPIIKRSLRNSLHRLKHISSEKEIEGIVKDNYYNIFYGRCKKFYVPDDLKDFI